MTAPLRTGDPIVVDVALDARSYQIVIGRGLIATLGQRIAALRPGAKAAVVSDQTVAKLHLEAALAALHGRWAHRVEHRGGAGRELEELLRYSRRCARR